MASLRRKSNSKYWFACFTLPDGRRTQRSTKTTDRKVAQKIADEFEHASRLRLTEQQARRVISDIYRTVSGNAVATATVREWFRQWLAAKAGTVSDATVQAYRSVADEFCEFLGNRADEEIVYVTTADIVSWRNLNGEKRSAVTANKKLKILRNAFREAWRNGVNDDDPAAKVSGLKVTPSTTPRRAFSVEELKSVLHVADEEWKGMILFGLYTGQRLGDLARLEWNHIDKTAETISFTTRKTGRRQILPLVAALRNWLEKNYPETKDQTGPLFPECFTMVSRAGRVGGLSNHFHDLLAEAGLAPERSHRKKKDGKGRSRTRQASELTFHSLRHTATSLMKNAGISPAIVQEFVGHDSKAMSDHYTHIETAALRSAAEAIPDVLN